MELCNLHLKVFCIKICKNLRYIGIFCDALKKYNVLRKKLLYSIETITILFKIHETKTHINVLICII